MDRRFHRPPAWLGLVAMLAYLVVRHQYFESLPSDPAERM